MILRDQYPDPVPKEIRDANFDTLVAYDLKTTGLSPKTESIIEIGAVKVFGGKVIESRDFVFQEFVRPYKKGLREEITQARQHHQRECQEYTANVEDFPGFHGFCRGLCARWLQPELPTRFLTQ